MAGNNNGRLTNAIGESLSPAAIKLTVPVSGFLGTDADDRQRIRENIRMLYEARSEIVHSGSGEASPFRNGASFVTGFELARRSLFKLLREGVPENWNKAATASE